MPCLHAWGRWFNLLSKWISKDVAFLRRRKNVEIRANILDSRTSYYGMTSDKRPLDIRIQHDIDLNVHPMLTTKNEV